MSCKYLTESFKRYDNRGARAPPRRRFILRLSSPAPLIFANLRFRPMRIFNLSLTYSVSIAFISMLLLQFLPVASASAAEPAADRPIADKWALVIGIDKFADPRIPTLKYSAKDAQDFASFLVNKGNFQKDHVLTLLNEQATHENIAAALGDTWLPRRVMKDDLVLIFVSTHGSPKELDVGNENWLIAHNTNVDRLFSTGVELRMLVDTVKRRTGCDRIVLLLDACNSGAAQTEGGKGLVRTNNFDVNSIVGEGAIVISSSDASQRSWESKRYKNGVFTRQLINTLDKGGDKVPLVQAFGGLQDSVAQEVRFDRKVTQTPVLKSKWKGKALALLAPPMRPRTIQAPSNSDSLFPSLPSQNQPASSFSSPKVTPSYSSDTPSAVTGIAKQVEKLTEEKRYAEAFELAHKGAENGDSECMKQMGNFYCFGQGVAQDYYKALEWWHRSAEKNNGRAMTNIGICYQAGQGVEKDEKKAIQWFEKASALDIPQAKYHLAMCYFRGQGVPKDPSRGLELLKKAADSGYDMAVNDLGVLYLEGIGVNKDYGSAVDCFRKSALKGNAIAQFNLGRCYYESLGVKQDYVQAVNWFQKAAAQNNSSAQNYLGNCYAMGRGVPTNLPQAAEWYKKAADQNDAAALNNLGAAYQNGIGVTVDIAKAIEYLQRSVDMNYGLACFNLGALYDAGRGVPVNHAKAVELYTKGAQLGHCCCPNAVGLHYFYGKGVPRDYNKAVQWFQEGAKRNCHQAQNSLGWAYLKGKGVPRDKATALTYFRLSAQQGNKLAQDNLKNYGN